MPGVQAGTQPRPLREGAGLEEKPPTPSDRHHPLQGRQLGLLCSCKSLTAPFQQESDISKAHQLSRCSDAQAIEKQFRGCGKAHPLVLERAHRGSNSGRGKLRKQQTSRAEPTGNVQSCQRAPHSGGGHRGVNPHSTDLWREPSSAPHLLCDQGYVALPPWAAVFPFATWT